MHNQVNGEEYSHSDPYASEQPFLMPHPSLLMSHPKFSYSRFMPQYSPLPPMRYHRRFYRPHFRVQMPDDHEVKIQASQSDHSIIEIDINSSQAQQKQKSKQVNTQNTDLAQYHYYDPCKAPILTSFSIKENIGVQKENNIQQEDQESPFIIVRAEKKKLRSRRFRLALMRKAKRNINEGKIPMKCRQFPGHHDPKKEGKKKSKKIKKKYIRPLVKVQDLKAERPSILPISHRQYHGIPYQYFPEQFEQDPRWAWNYPPPSYMADPRLERARFYKGAYPK